jgi:AAA15 family ATPase/GTPase
MAPYKQLLSIGSKSLRAGWKQLSIAEEFDGKKMITYATHVNDGLLRLIAILAELDSRHGLLLFDEIENGINPELVEFVTDALVKAPQQVLVTTHSPMILNYLDDEVAKKGVMYLYKTPQGHTQAVPFFKIPSIAAKLEVMGPGEAFVDTNLTELHKEITSMSTSSEEKI